MIKNYFKIAWRNLIKNKGYSVINIGGLALGMAVVMLIGLWIYDELTYNQNHDNYERIAQVMINKTSSKGVKRTRQSLPYPLGNELRESYTNDFDYVVMSSNNWSNILSVKEKSISKKGVFMEPDALRMLSLDMIYGDWDGLKGHNAIVLSESTAQTLFGDDNPIGKFMKLNNKLNLEITGVYKDIPFNAKFSNLEFIAPWSLYVATDNMAKYARKHNMWDNNSFLAYVQIAEDKGMSKVSSKIKTTIYDNLSSNDRSHNPEILLHPMKDWHLRSNWENGVKTGGFIQYVWLFGCIGLFVLLLACINFMNLSTAQSEKRAKEVGIRKTVGSSKFQLINQFLSESFLVVCIAYLLALVIVITAIPSFNVLTDKHIVVPFYNSFFILISIGFIVVTGLLSGSYPALYLSSFRPVKVLKGAFKAGHYAIAFRKVLVVTQFTTSVILIIGTIVVQKQIEHSKNRSLGYEKDGLVMIEKMTEDFTGKYNILRNELIKSGGAIEMSESNSPLTNVWSSGGGFQWSGKDPSLSTNFVIVCIGHDYGKTIGWNMVKGRDFSRSFSTDSTAFVFNESAIKYMGIEDPIGKTVNWANQDHKIIGVVKDMLRESPFNPVKPEVYMIKYDNTNWINLKLNPEKSVSASLALVESVFKKQFPNVPFNYEFVDETFTNKFAAEERIRSLSIIFSFFAIFISCLGLFGLASFMAEQRTKEIGIRKVVGASIFNLWKLLSKDFVKLVALSIVIATPLAYYGVVSWLNNYTYQTEISWWIFVVSGMGAIVITLLTVSFQAIKAAISNPIKSLRTE